MSDYVYANLGEYESVSGAKSYIGVDTATIHTVVDSDLGTVKGDVKVSNIANNNLSVKTNGLYTPTYKIEQTSLSFTELDDEVTLKLVESIRDYLTIDIKYYSKTGLYNTLHLATNMVNDYDSYSLSVIEQNPDNTKINSAVLTVIDDNTINLSNNVGIIIKSITGTNLVTL